MPVPKIESEAIEEFEKQLEAHPRIDRKGANNPYTSVNGHMFSCVNKAGEVGLRLSKPDREAFIEEHGTAILKSYGHFMREYVVVPLKVLKTSAFQKYLDMSFDYARSLKPKPTKKG